MLHDPLVEKARKYALKYHHDQRYGDEFPYVIHLQAVESVLLRFGIRDSHLRAAAWLHDVLEDTTATYDELGLLFPMVVVDAVAAVTEPKGGNRKWRHSQTYPRIRQNADAIVIKLADRIANIEHSGDKVGMYVKEYEHFKSEIFGHGFKSTHSAKIQGLWNHLDNLIIELLDIDSEVDEGPSNR